MSIDRTRQGRADGTGRTAVTDQVGGVGDGPLPVLVGVRAYAADGMRYLLALYVGFAVAFFLLSGGSFLQSGIAAEVEGWARALLVLAVVTLLGHVLVSKVRGFVSIPASAFFTWVALIAVVAVTTSESGWDSLVAGAWFAGIFSTPLVVVATALRAFVPWFQVHVDGRAVRPQMSSSHG